MISWCKSQASAPASPALGRRAAGYPAPPLGLNAPASTQKRGATNDRTRLLAFALTLATEQAPAVELLDPLDLGARVVPKGEAIDVTLPALPARDGHLTALRFRAVIASASKAGCNYNASVSVNGTALGRYSAGGHERLLGRLPGFELAAGNYASFPSSAAIG